MADKKYQNQDKKIPQRKEFLLLEPKTLIIAIITSVLTLLIAFFGENGVKFLSSVISTVPEHAPFNGTTFPIKQVPNWVRLTEAERKAAYSAIPQEKLMPIPPYNPTRLAIPDSTLKWNDPVDDSVRNEKITYPVPYLGSYKLDGLENSGSHPAIDIKVPEGTPLYAMANGTVIKAEYSNGGFGNHIVLQHNNFPSLDDPNASTTIFSSYSHLNSISVKVNDVVTKGQLIGFSGSSGTATTPHLHFQIDNANSSWHPYWPFSGTEQRAAGYSFFQAINNGLGQGNAIAYTINPLRYAQKYFGDQTLVASAAPIISSSAPDPYENIAFVIQMPSGTSFEEGSEIRFIIQAFDSSGSLLTKPRFKDTVKLSLLNGNGTLNTATLSAFQLKTGIVNILKMTNAKPGKDKLILRFRDKEFSSPDFEITAKQKKLQGFTITPTKTLLTVNESTSVVATGLDDAGVPVSDFVFDDNPTVGLTNSIGSLSISSLANSPFLNGATTFSFTATNPGSVSVVLSYHGQMYSSGAITVTAPLPAEPAPAPTPAPISQPQTPETLASTDSQTSVLNADATPKPEPEPASTQPASATPAPAPQSESESQASPPPYLVVPTAPAPSTSPVAQPVAPSSPAAINQTPSGPPLPFSDIPTTSSHYEALTYLKANSLVAGYADGTFQPDKEVSRAEAVTFILRAINEKVREKSQFVFPDVTPQAWYRQFIATAYELGFVKGYPDGTFKPESKVNLAEFLTMLFVGAKIDVDPQIDTSLPAGVTPNDWFAPYVQEAIRKNIIEMKDNFLQPEKPLTRGEIAEILWKFMKLTENL